MGPVRYKEFSIVVKVQPECASNKMFRVIVQIYRNLEEPPVCAIGSLSRHLPASAMLMHSV